MDKDLEALGAAIMAEIEGAETQGLRKLLWRSRIEGVVVGFVLGCLGAVLFHALVYQQVIFG